MSHGQLRRGLSIVALAAATVLAACAQPEVAEVPPAPVAPPPPPPLALNQGVAEAAAVYVAYMRDAQTIEAGFPTAESIQATLRRGAAYEPGQLSRGLIAYGSILALQSPEFVAGVRSFAVDPTQRQQIVARIIADPAYAATFPGAAEAAGLIAATIGADSAAMLRIADAVEGDAYTIQERTDPRRRWATVHISNRETRLESVKTISAATMLPSAEESARLFNAANTGSGLSVAANRQGPPFTPAVVHSLAIAALAALGAGGDDNRANTEALQVESNSEFCLNMSKLMLFQCLAASRPSYEDMFCVGRHVARDLSTCTAAMVTPAALPAPTTQVAEGASVTPVAAEAAAASTNAVQTANN
jgi:hypothetical protein